MINYAINKVQQKYILLLSMFLISCTGKDVENITIKGTVFNKHTQKPIKNENIVIEIECWKYANSPDESYAEHEKKHVETDHNGNYTVSFNKGAFVTFNLGTNEHGGYFVNASNLYINKSENIYNIYLIPIH
ncbi:hypothetical protein [Flavobacterium chungangense]|uniref:Intradiol ring-cleavage dioxygenases domain-containing protein n=1 Tax=Flavobacterium chungangense TaxID=554283 RepID=A0A6V6YS69_9FLAO|nr:hypothetical protein [Flavobacterium chungangense]CAD0002256.1 hypothetical protein FLACHUCJ7_00910 [Flavobacterium chungangense]